MRWITAGVLALGSACGSPAPSCKEAITKSAKATKTPDVDIAMVASLCEEQGWSDSVRRCIANASSDQEASTCIENPADDAVRAVAKARAESEAAKARATEAERAAARAVKEAQATRGALDQLCHDLDDLNTKITGAVDAVAAAQNETDRAAAKAQLVALQERQAVMKTRIEAAKIEAINAERLKGVRVSKECLDNPLAKGCS